MSKPNGHPDSAAQYFLGYEPNPLRYDYLDPSDYEAHNTIGRMVDPNSSVIEIGCGTGILGEVLRNLGRFKYEGYEPSHARAQKAVSKGLKVHNRYIDESNISDLGLCDVVVLADVIEHLGNPYELLQLAQKIMHSSSVIIISVPNVAHWSVRLGLCAGKFQYTETGILDSTHLRWFTVDTLVSFLKRSGFNTTTVKYTSGYMLPCYQFLRKGIMKLIPHKAKERGLAYLVRLWPRLFACQIIVSCKKQPRALGV
jgi:methionine biosynthesis protein MetW